MMAASSQWSGTTAAAINFAVCVLSAILIMLAARVGKRLLGLHVDVAAERTAHNVGGAVLSLLVFLLAMMLASARTHFDQVRSAHVREAEAIRQLDATWQAIARPTGSAKEQQLIPPISEYLATVETEEREVSELGAPALNSQASAIISQWRKIAFDMTQEAQRQHLLERVMVVEQTRHVRLVEASQEPSVVFFSGVALLFFASMLLFDWGAYGRHGVLLGIILSITLASVVGIILEFEHPYEGLLQVEPLSSFFAPSGP